MSRKRLNVSLLSLFIPLCAFAQSASLTWSTTAYTDGRHNAFTDLVYWKDAYYLCFRHAESHMSMDGEIRVMTSTDLSTWIPCGTLNTLGDDRDPHFTVTPDALYVYFGVWDLAHQPDAKAPDRGSVRSHFASTTDGANWSPVKGVYQPGFWLWRVRYHDGAFYSPAYTAVRPKPDLRETRLLRSDDGIHWTQLATVTQARMSGEADLLWRPDGEVWLFTRTNDKPGDSMWYKSDADMRAWRGAATGVLVHSPVFAEWGERIFVSGRGRTNNKSNTAIWEIDGNKLHPLITLPSGGDTSYPGLIPDPAAATDGPATLLVSWYSQHENTDPKSHTANIYVGRVTVSERTQP